MKINGKVHCFFEQSGTFKNEFINLGIPAEDYDIQDDFNQTDHIIDLFHEIDSAYQGGGSIFDEMSSDDLIVAFYPCIYFCDASQCAFRISHINYRSLSFDEKIEKILERNINRSVFYERLVKFVCVCARREIRLVIENPWSGETYLKGNFLKQPDVVDMNRLRRGDYYRKPTAYWFFNCEPTYGESWQADKNPRTVYGSKSSKTAGVCSEERSLISSDYARNFICDFIIGKNQSEQMSLFEEVSK